MINLLREYRTSLIADVAAGRLDVRDAAAGLPSVSESLDFDTVLDDIAEIEEMNAVSEGEA